MPSHQQRSFDFSSPVERSDSPRALPLPDAELLFWERFYPEPEADALFGSILDQTEWKQDTLTIFGKSHQLPRLTAWYGDPGASYIYSGITNTPLPWTPMLRAIRDRLREKTGDEFNSVLLNLYRDGDDTVGWHQDNEAQFGKEPVIASLSLGAERHFQMRNKLRKELDRVDIPLTHGSLLLMKGRMQTFWKHRVPRSRRVTGPRINLTFRNIQSEGTARRDLYKRTPKKEAKS